jgi:hypothetical protein
MVSFFAHILGEDFSIYSKKSQASLVDLRSSSTSLNELGSAVSPFDITEQDFLIEGSRSCKSHTGGRVLDAIIRAYAAKTAGKPRLMRV